MAWALTHYPTPPINCEGQTHKTESTDHNFVVAGNVGFGLYSYRHGLRPSSWDHSFRPCLYLFEDSSAADKCRRSCVGEALIWGNY